MKDKQPISLKAYILLIGICIFLVFFGSALFVIGELVDSILLRILGGLIFASPLGIWYRFYDSINERSLREAEKKIEISTKRHFLPIVIPWLRIPHLLENQSFVNIPSLTSNDCMGYARSNVFVIWDQSLEHKENITKAFEYFLSIAEPYRSVEVYYLCQFNPDRCEGIQLEEYYKNQDY